MPYRDSEQSVYLHQVHGIAGELGGTSIPTTRRCPGVPEQEQPSSGDGSGGTEGDVNMDKDEIDRLVKATNAKTEAQGNEDVDMTGASSSGPASYGNGQPSRPTPKPKTTLEAAEKEKKEAEDEQQAEEEEEENKRQENASEMPAWATRMVPGCLMHCVDVCHGK